MKKTILFLAIIALSFVGKAQCHVYDTAKVNTTNVGGNIDSTTLSASFYVVLQADTMKISPVCVQRTILFKVSSSWSIVQCIGYSDQYVYNWVQQNYKPW